MKTAMQELIEKVEHAISYNVEGGLVEKYTWTELFNDMELALEKEKEQIIDFAYGCVQHISREDIEQYYNKLYNQIPKL
jgi:hypothetical protein